MIQQEPPFPAEMSPTSPLLSPQKSTSQTPLLQQAPPPSYQSPDTNSWQQTGITSNRLEFSCLTCTLFHWTHMHTVTLVCLILFLQPVQPVRTGCRAGFWPAGGLQQHEHHCLHGWRLQWCQLITSYGATRCHEQQ